MRLISQQVNVKLKSPNFKTKTKLNNYRNKTYEFFEIIYDKILI